MTATNQQQQLHVLIVEDNEDDALLLVDTLKAEGYSLEWIRVDTDHDMREALEQHWDIVFSDFSMPNFSGSQALSILRQHDPDIPFIFVSGTVGEDSAVEAMKAGAQDYVMKGQLARLSPTVERELREVTLRRQRREAEQTLRKISMVVNQAADSVFITDANGCIEYVNPAFEKLTGYSEDEIKGKTPAILRSDNHGEDYFKKLWNTIKQGNIFRGTMVNLRKNGEIFYEEKVIAPIKDDRGMISHYVSTGRDITERIKAEEARTRLAAILEATPDLVAILDPEGCLTYLNGAGRKLLGLKQTASLEGRCMKDIFPEPVAQQLITDILPTVLEDGSWTGETILTLPQHKEMPVSQVVLAHYDSEKNIEYFSTIARDITERKHFEAELQHRATHDTLTELPNRFHLINRFSYALDHARRTNTYIAVLFLDLDNFKRVNDSLGHASGDILLQQVAKRLASSLRPNDTVARHGGDEFTIVAGGLEREEGALSILRKLITAFERPVFIGSHEVYVTFSTGISIYPHDGDRVDDLLRNADTAMYRAKSSGSNQYRFYAPDMNTRGHELLSLEADLRHALDREEFLLHYQPQIDLQSRRMVGAEALLRWQHPVRGLISPADFIPLLENCGLIIPVGEWIMHQTCKMHRLWREAGYEPQRISINVSAAQFNDSDLLNKIQLALHEEGMSPEHFELEITENIVMQDPIGAAEVLQSLRALGVRIAIDDFGTGYSSLAYLKRFPLNVLKIDQTFVSDLCTNTGDAAIVETSIALAKKLGLEVIAEGVETRAQLDFLRNQDCDMVQGYFLGRPAPADEFVNLLTKTWQWN